MGGDTIYARRYVAPEVLSSRLYGPPCDVWALGVITYILLVSYVPMGADGSFCLSLMGR